MTRTIENLRLDVAAAQEGKTWLLLPDGFRDQKSGRNYPLPTRGKEIAILANIYVPPRVRDSGGIYLRRCLKRHKYLQQRKVSATHNIERFEVRAGQAHENHQTALRKFKAEAATAVDEVRAKADEAIASLTDLFSLGRRGLSGQMKAHLDKKDWQGEEINARAFRECFRMVTQAVKGLGLPSDQRKEASESIIKEAAAAVEATREAVSLNAGFEDDGEPPTEH